MSIHMPNIIEITDFAVPELDIYARLTEAQLRHYYEPEIGLFIAESPNVILRALDAGYIPMSLLLERKHVDGQAREVIARCGDVPVYTADLDILTQLVGYQLTRGVLCVMRRRQLPSVEEVCAGARRIAILENVMNPTNVGAIFRSAAALNMDAVLLTPACSDPLYRRAARVSMGTVFQVPWTYLSSEDIKCPEFGNEVAQYSKSYNPAAKCAKVDVELLRNLGFKTAAMALSDDSIRIDDPVLRSEQKLAIVLGTEGDGLSQNTIDNCDYTVRIPMSHGVDSLNVAAASAVAFWELGR